MTGMTEQQIRSLYAIAMAYDNRRLSEANITAWTEQALRNRWTYDEAAEAVHTHHATSTEYLMPAHITAIIKNQRSKPENVSESRQIEGAPPAQPERIQSIVAELGRRLGWKSRDRSTEDAAVLAVECPSCHAAPKRPCTRQVTQGAHRGEHKPLKQFHPSRSEVAQ